jgi:hypothetical protein
MKSQIVSRSSVPLLVFFICIHLFGPLFGASLGESQMQPSLPKDQYFEDFAKNFKSDYVKYDKKANKLILFAYPPIGDDVALGIGSALLFLLGDYLYNRARAAYDNSEQIFSGVGAAASIVGSVVGAYFIYKHYKIRNEFVPYMVFGTKGLQVLGEYVLEWKNVDRAEDRTLRTSVPHVSRLGDTYYTYKEDVVTISTLYVDKFGSPLYTLYGNDNYLPSPVSYDNVRTLCDYCLAMYGIEKFKNK